MFYINITINKLFIFKTLKLWETLKQPIQRTCITILTRVIINY